MQVNDAFYQHLLAIQKRFKHKKELIKFVRDYLVSISGLLYPKSSLR